MLDAKMIPAADRASKRLMIVLHGLGDSMAGYTWMPDALKFPWLNYLLVNAPDDYYGGYSWFDFPHQAEAGVRRSIKLLNELLDAQRAAGFPTEETVLCGFSQGCLMTLETGLRYPHRLAALIGLSGWVLDPPTLLREAAPAARQQRVLVVHGTLDPLIPYPAVKMAMEMLKAGGIPLDWHEFNMPHTIIEEEVTLIRRFIASVFSDRA